MAGHNAVNTLKVKFEADMNKLLKSMARLEGRADVSFGKIEKRGKALERRLSGISPNFSRLFGAAGVGIAARGIQIYADAWTSAGNKIKAASQVAGLQARSLSKLNDLADENRAGLSETVDLYARLLRASKGVAKSEKEVAQVTGIAIKAFKAGGASAGEFKAGVLQLGQALGSGFLQGDELRSLRENAPLIAQAIAKEFKTTIGGLKKLGAEGKLTSQRVFRAILAGQSEIEAAFSKTNATIGDSFIRLGNALAEYVGVGDNAIGGTKKLVAALTLLSENLNLVAAAASILAVRSLSPLAITLAKKLAVAAVTASVALRGITSGATLSAVAMRGLGGAVALQGGSLGAIIAAGVGVAYVFSQMETSAERLASKSGSLKESLNDLADIGSVLTEAYKNQEQARKELARAEKSGNQEAIDAKRITLALINEQITANKTLQKQGLLKTEIKLKEARTAQAIRKKERDSFAEGRLVTERLSASGVAASSPFERIKREAEEYSKITKKQIKDFLEGEDEKIKLLIDEGKTITTSQKKLLELNAEWSKSEAKVADLATGVNEVKQAIVNAKDSTHDLADASGEVNFDNATKSATAFKNALIQALKGADALANQSFNDLKTVKIKLATVGDPVERAGLLAGLKYDRKTKLPQENSGVNSSFERTILNKKRQEVLANVEKGAKFKEELRKKEEALRKRNQKDSASTSPKLSPDKYLAQAEARVAATISETQALSKLDPLSQNYERSVTRLVFARDLLNGAEAAGLKTTPELKENIEELAETYALAQEQAYKLLRAKNRLTQQAEAFDSLGRDVLGGFIRDLREGKNATEALGGALNKIADKLLDMAVNNLFDNVFGGGFGKAITGFLGGGGKVSGSLPGRAHGGPIEAGKPYMVGERGPEVVIPKSSGTVIPNSRLTSVGNLAVGSKNSGRLHVTSEVLVSVDSEGALKAYVTRTSQNAASTAVNDYDKNHAGRRAIASVQRYVSSGGDI